MNPTIPEHPIKGSEILRRKDIPRKPEQFSKTHFISKNSVLSSSKPSNTILLKRIKAHQTVNIGYSPLDSEIAELVV
jgi:hypothetical protein